MTGNWENFKRQERVLPREPLKRNRDILHLILEFESSELWENKFELFQSYQVWHCVVAVLETQQCVKQEINKINMFLVL